MSLRIVKFQSSKHQVRMFRITTPQTTRLQAMSEEITAHEITRQGITKRRPPSAKWKQATNLLAARVRSPRNGTSKFRRLNHKMSNPGGEIPKRLMWPLFWPNTAGRIPHVSSNANRDYARCRGWSSKKRLTNE